MGGNQILVSLSSAIFLNFLVFDKSTGCGFTVSVSIGGRAKPRPELTQKQPQQRTTLDVEARGAQRAGTTSFDFYFSLKRNR